MKRAVAFFGSLRDRLTNAIERSRIIGGLDAIESMLQLCAGGSRIVQWFFAEPDPAVIVIDLRETYTVGPVLGALEWAAVRGDHLAERTGLTAVANRASKRLAAEPLRVAGWGLSACAVGGFFFGLPSGRVAGGWLVLAGVGLLVSRERRSASELAETRVGRAVVAAFEPPEPPERGDGR